MYIYEKCYMGFCTPKRTIMESKKKKKKKTGKGTAKERTGVTRSVVNFETVDRLARPKSASLTIRGSPFVEHVLNTCQTVPSSLSHVRARWDGILTARLTELLFHPNSPESCTVTGPRKRLYCTIWHMENLLRLVSMGLVVNNAKSTTIITLG